MNHEIAANLFDDLAEHAAVCQPVIIDSNGKEQRLPEVTCTMAATFKACSELARMSASGVHDMFGDEYTMNDFIADLAATSLKSGQRMRRAMAKMNPLDRLVIHRAISIED